MVVEESCWQWHNFLSFVRSVFYYPEKKIHQTKKNSRESLKKKLSQALNKNFSNSIRFDYCRFDEFHPVFIFSFSLGYLIDIGGGCDVFVVVFPLTFLSSSYLNDDGGSDGGMLYPRASFKNEENEKAQMIV